MRSSVIFFLTLFGSIAFGAPTYRRVKPIPIAEYLDTTLTDTETEIGGALDTRFKSADKRASILPVDAIAAAHNFLATDGATDLEAEADITIDALGRSVEKRLFTDPYLQNLLDIAFGDPDFIKNVLSDLGKLFNG